MRTKYDFYEKFGIDRKVVQFVESSESKITESFKQIEDIARSEERRVGK